MQYIVDGYTGIVDNSRVTVHSLDGHIIICRPTEITTIEGLEMLVQFIVEEAS